jgi:beta-galactosidase
MRAIALALMLPLAAGAVAPDTYFPERDMMTIGVYYYPEAWPREQWARDITNIKRFGFEFVHMAEFAWAFMEPEDGRFDFEWLEANVRLAAQQGLKVALCTPSATPPAWLARKHPEILAIDHRGRRMNHGGRAHATWSSPVYRRYVERIVTELARRFGNHPAVWGGRSTTNSSSWIGAMDSGSPPTSRRRSSPRRFRPAPLR